MTSYNVVGVVDATVAVEIEADSPEQALEMASERSEMTPMLCHQCANDIEVTDVTRMYVEDLDNGGIVLEEKDFCVLALERQLAAERKRVEALEAFAREGFAAAFNGCDWDGAGIQEKGAELGLLREERFDPDKHPNVDASEVETGETIYVFTDLMNGKGE